MRRSPAFTLVEIVIAVAIMSTLLLLAVPSLEGVLADRKLRASLDAFNKLVRQAKERSISEHRPYLIVWNDKYIFVLTVVFRLEYDHQHITYIYVYHGTVLLLSL